MIGHTFPGRGPYREVEHWRWFGELLTDYGRVAFGVEVYAIGFAISVLWWDLVLGWRKVISYEHETEPDKAPQ